MDGRFIRITLAVAAVAGLVLVGMSVLVAALPVSMMPFVALNAGLTVAFVDAHRKLVKEQGDKVELRRSFEVGAVGVITGSALVGSHSVFGLNAEVFLATALLVLTTGYAGFYFGVFANKQSHTQVAGDQDAAQHAHSADG